VFNGDPHPGNYIFDADGRIVFLDYGCIKFFPEPMMAVWRKLVCAHLDGNQSDFMHQVLALGFFKPEAKLPTQPVFDYFGYFYEPFRVDRTFTFTRDYNAKSMEMVFKPKGDIAPLHRQMNMPPDFLLVNRIQWGVYSILAQLDAVGNWYRIHREYLFDDEPSTDLGRADHAYRARWCAERKLPQHLVVTPEGIRGLVAA
jgi:predicted unusual protein kinase regulating ubiquinone biosynthesis (AarF/ABC1/UbiB family)